MKYIHTLAIAISSLFLIQTRAAAQGMAVNTSGSAADASAILDASSTTKGFLPPRMTATQLAAISSPAAGLIVYQTTGTTGLYINNGTSSTPVWQQLAAKAPMAYGSFYAGTTIQSIPSSSYANTLLANTSAASGLSMNSGTGNVTIATTGIYRIAYTVCLYTTSATTYFVICAIHVNSGSTYLASYSSLVATPAYNTTQYGETIVSLNAGDVIALQTSTSAPANTIFVYPPISGTQSAALTITQLQ